MELSRGILATYKTTFKLKTENSRLLRLKKHQRDIINPKETKRVKDGEFEFVGLVAGTKFWSLRLDFVAKMASSHDATAWSLRLVAGTSRRD